MSSRVSDAKSALTEAKVRHDDIMKIEQSIEELVQLFQDMSLLLDTQQELVNTIEAQVENTAVYVEEGSKQVGQAIEYRKKSRRVGDQFSRLGCRTRSEDLTYELSFIRDGGGFVGVSWCSSSCAFRWSEHLHVSICLIDIPPRSLSSIVLVIYFQVIKK